MAIFSGSLQRTLSRFELAIAAIVIFIIASLFLRQVLLLAARAEKMFLDSSIININAALHRRAALYYLKGEKDKLAAMDGMNPLDLMQSGQKLSISLNQEDGKEFYSEIQYQILPVKYGGEVETLDMDRIENGYWYFDRSQKTLVYSVRNDEFFHSDSLARAIIRYQVRLNYEDRNSNNRYDPATDIYIGVKLENLGGFQWEI